MSEKLYALLLRLYPSHFRKAYGDQAQQLVRDRLRDESGFFPRLRLWLNLIADLAISIPREHRRLQPTLAHVTAPSPPNLALQFRLLEDTSAPRPSAFVGASAIVLTLFALIATTAGTGGSARPLDFRRTRTLSSSETLAPGKSSGQIASSTSVRGTHPSGADPHFAVLAVASTHPVPVAFASPLDATESTPLPPLQPKLEDATTAVLQAFHTHNVVMFGEAHGGKQEYEWLCRLVNAPGFADRVDDIVVEFGNARYQDTVDRYVAGENVPFNQVQKAWRNMVASVPPVSPVYGWFYKAVRDANLKHRGRHQIRLLMGSPPADWDKIKTASDLAPYEAEREQWYAQVVKDEVLAKHHRALLIMGAGHFLRGRAPALQDELLIQQHRPVPPLNTVQLGPGYIERQLRDAGAAPYLIVLGSNVIDDQGDVDKRFDSWPAPVVVSLSGNWVGNLQAQPVVSDGRAPATPLTLAEEADAMLYVAPCSAMREVFPPRAEVEGTSYGQEVARRDRIFVGHTIDFQYGEVPQCVLPEQTQR
jgi:hypothetical protein